MEDFDGRHFAAGFGHLNAIGQQHKAAVNGVEEGLKHDQERADP